MYLKHVYSFKHELLSAFTAGGSFWLYIGGYDIYNEKINRWMDSTPVDTGFQNWADFEPDDVNEYYMGISRTDGVWADNLGMATQNYICELGLI